MRRIAGVSSSSAGEHGALMLVPSSRILTHEQRDAPSPRRRPFSMSTLAASKASMALGALALAMAITLFGAPAAEALGLL
jgi:hypothetical protein